MTPRDLDHNISFTLCYTSQQMVTLHGCSVLSLNAGNTTTLVTVCVIAYGYKDTYLDK